MADSLRDQLLKSGICKQMRDEKRAWASALNVSKKVLEPSYPRKAAAANNEEPDLASAYAMRARTEALERRRAECEGWHLAQQKRERKQKIQQLLAGKALNQIDAGFVRHFEYGGKIRRIYLTAMQRSALNAGKLGIVQQNGRYLLVERTVAEQVRDLNAHLLALLLEPGNEGDSEDGVPDDLIW